MLLFPQILRKHLGLALLLPAIGLFMVACKGDNNENPNTISPGPSQNIVQTVGANTQLTLLNAALTRPDIDLGATKLGTSDPGPYTFFAPTDDALRAAGFADVNAINNAPKGALTNILLYHIVSGTAITSSALSGSTTAIGTASGPLYVTKTSSGSLSVNGARVISPDIVATNGVVHVIDQVLLPSTPTSTILALVQADTSLSLLTTAALRGGAAVTGALSGTTPLTVFAPTNAAFQAAGLASTTAINAADVSTLTAILTNHVVANARAYSPTLTNAQTITTFAGGTLTVTVGSNNAISLLSRGNGTNASVILTGPTNRDITATNGVIHKINRVLLP